MRTKIGEFEVTSGKIRATDPCYDVSTWCAGFFDSKNGIYEAFVTYADPPNWGRRVATLEISHIEHRRVQPTQAVSFEVGVDSGQAGFFDADKYAANQGGEYGDLETFYGKACHLTRYQTDDAKDYERDPIEGGRGKYIGPELPGAGTMEWGAVSSSGYGDGGYTCEVGKDSLGLVVAAKITFIGDEDDIDEED